MTDNWARVKLDDLIEFSEAGTSVNSEDRPPSDNELGILKTSAVTYGSFDITQQKAILKSEEHRVSVTLRKDTILISRMNTLAFVGASAYVDQDYKNIYLPDRLWPASRKENAPVDMRWLSCALSSPRMRRKISNIASGTSGSMKNITKPNLLDLEISLPPLPEQHKIAEILSTWDEAITLTARLISALQKRKKGLVQRLLTAQVRFPGFNEEWRETELGEFFYFYSKKNSTNEDLTVLSCSTIHGIVPQTVIFGKRIASKDIRRYKVVQRGDLIFDPMLLWDASIGFLEVIEKGVISPAYSTFKFRKNSSNREYFKYLLKTHYYRQHYKYISQGTNVRRRKAPVDAFLKLKVILPTSREEQDKITDILKTCDQEIELLSRKLEALKQQKNGLMQKLLTGQIRVKV